MSISLQQFDEKMWQTLTEEDTKEHIAKDTLQNGLMTWGAPEVSRVGFAVSENMAVYELAAKEQCDAVVVHHGLSIPGKALDRIVYDRLAFLIKNNISLWSAHYTLDAHSVHGNNAQIMKLIGAKQTDRTWFEEAQYGAPWGFIGELSAPSSITDIVSKTAERFSPKTVVYDFGPKEIRKVAVISGAGGPSNDQLLAMKAQDIDLYITGEVREWHQEMAREVGIHIIAGGHWHTETFGVQTLMPEVESWGVETVWLGVENPL